MRGVLIIGAGLLAASVVAAQPVPQARGGARAVIPAGRAAVAAVDRRQERMKQVGRAIRTLTAFAKGDVQDPKHARQAAAVLVVAAREMPRFWPEGTAVGVGDSRSKPALWADRAALARQVASFPTAAAGVSQAAASGERNAVARELETLGRTCRSCHAAFQARN